MRVFLALLLLPVLAIAATSSPATVTPVNNGTISWTPALQFTDGTAEAASDIGSSNIAYGACSNNTPQSISIPAGTFTAAGGATHADIPSSIPPGTYCFTVTTVSLVWGAGEVSNAVKATLPSASVPPTGPVTTATTVYFVVTGENTHSPLPVGTVPLGLACLTTDPLFKNPPYMAVPWTSVTYSGTLKPHAVIAACQ